ncbi:MAG: alanine--tRNA ligase [Ignavibacteriales bacterium]
MLQGQDIRKMFVEYFVGKDHSAVKSSSLIPIDDPTLLFSNAGMNQFKDVFLGIDKRDYNRAVTVQKCMRAGGKHNDLDTVGRTARHHTFFEMLGNFSFGDYFKQDAIGMAWDFLTRVIGLPEEKLWITIYNDDDEAFQLWQQVAGVRPERIKRLGAKDNFWAMGDTGPCGPCSEIHYDRGPDFSCDGPECALGVCDCDRWLEVWNLVFMQYERDQQGNLDPLPKPSIDTGMGLERLTSIMQGVNSNFETDLFWPIIQEIEHMTGQKYQKDMDGFPFRVIADHIRACTFLIADGVLPSNEGRGYVLRRILRRAVRFGKRLGMNEPFFYTLIPVVVKLMGEAYPEIQEKQSFVEQVIKMEEERFFVTLTEGLKKVEDIIMRLGSSGDKIIPGDETFMLYDTYGFPIDLTEDVAEEHGLTVDKVGFEAMMAKQKERGRKSFKSDDAFSMEKTVAGILEGESATDFVGYQCIEWEPVILKIIINGQAVDHAVDGEATIVLSETPFYAESGGQVTDKGVIEGPLGKMQVSDVQKVAGWVLHHGSVTGTLGVNEVVKATLDEDRRRATAANHTATHLLHRALHEVIGEHAQQKGSLVEPDRLRFDFSHFTSLSLEEIKNIENIVNRKIWELLPVGTLQTSLDEAKKLGAMALFGEKYGDNVRVVQVETFSRELCGGTHVKNTGEIGLFRIISEGSVGAGLRRIEAVTGQQALNGLRTAEEELKKTASILKTSPLEVSDRIENLSRQLREKEKELENLKARLEKEKASDIMDAAIEINGVKVLIAEIEVSDINSLRQNAEMLKDKLGTAVVILGSKLDDKVGFAAFAAKEVVNKGVHAGQIIGQIAKIAGGGGGGRPDMAQAGGKDPGKLSDALDKAKEIVMSSLG